MARRQPKRPNEPTMQEALAYFLTWTTCGTWLPGDERGWVAKGKGLQEPNSAHHEMAKRVMVETPCWLSPLQREIVEATIKQHCEIRGWHLHAVNCRTNHVHVVVTADKPPDEVRNQFKAWCTRKLKEHLKAIGEPVREHWWTEGGSQRYLSNDESLEASVIYVNEFQDDPRVVRR